jgi:preprotein translocase SecE subunit
MSRRAKRKSTQQREFDPSRFAHFIFVAGGFVAAWVLTHLVEDSWALLWSYWPQVGRPEALTANLIGIGVAVAGTLWAWRKPQWFKFCTEVVVEVSQITWPTKPEIRIATIVVIVITLIASAILAAMDTVWSEVTDLLYGI